ncbi:glycosyltransferase [Clostridium sp. ZS2-4]|uniref:glycosyltransferase n=1 Tax=Clostridium sp. ZS2-4 TaxID=2987703 RepID=UPI00227C6E9E|nr:glycosyltransferase [Clostridium sp. ZS2-4]MCY6356045.1 glycosyltransferase [Clostridium sp. ZS2-4]
MENKKKIVFFVLPNLDSFINEIINRLSEDYDTKKIIVTQWNQIDEGMKWADICWFEWCDALIIYGSKQEIAKEKKIICRLHSYEAFTNNMSQVNWENVDKVIFVAEHIRNIVLNKVNINVEKTIVIPNGINLDRHNYKERENGFNIAYVGYINFKKGPMLLFHTFKAIFNRDNRYKLYIAGTFNEERYVLYFQQMIKEMGMENNIIFSGWQKDINKWLEDKNYLISTSVLEGHPVGIMESMAKGIKPIIHNFVGARGIYPEKYVWNTIDEAVKMISSDDYNSSEYRKFIVENYSLKEQVKVINKILKDLFNINYKINKSKNNIPLVTVGISNYNSKKHLAKCVESFLNQTYPNLEILLVDDCSTDGSKEIIQQYEKNYNNIRGIHHNKNSGGASKGIQEIIKEGKGKYFQLMAGDDFVEKDTIEKFVEYLEKNENKDYVYSDLNIVDENNNLTDRWRYSIYNPNQIVYKIFHTGSGVIPMNCMFRKAFFIKNGLSWIIYKGNDFSADTLNSLVYIKHGWRYGKIEEPVIYYRLHSQNLSYNIEKRMKAEIALVDYIIENFSEEIYFPQINWAEYRNKSQLKNYLLADFFYKRIEKYINLRGIPAYIQWNGTKKDMVKYVYGFAEEGMRYVEKGLNQGNDYYAQLQKLKEKYKEYFKNVVY